MSVAFAEVADRVYVLRHPGLQVNVTLVVGGGAALLVDTLSTPAQAAELAAAARKVSTNPWILVNTHHHFDHCFGNAMLAGDPPAPVYAHEATATLLREQPELVRLRAYEEMLPNDQQLAAELAQTPILAPTHPVHREAAISLGDRRIELRHFGPGHTGGDLVVRVPDADVLITGDLVEESGPPQFEDAYPLQWPDTVAELLRLVTPDTVVVPGHGALVDADFVRGQHADLAALEWLIREGHCDGAPPERVAANAPFDPPTALTAARRGYAELAGRA